MLNSSQLSIAEIPLIYDVLIADLYNAHRMPDGFDIKSELWKNITFIHEYLTFLEFSDL